MNNVKSKLKFRAMISVLIILFLMAISFVGSYVLEALEWGPTPMYILSPDYAIMRGTLCQLDPNNFDPEIVVITRTLTSVVQEKVLAFYVKDNWILGKTNAGYLAIETTKNQINYPIESTEKLQELSGLSVNSSDWTSNRDFDSKYLYRRPQVQMFRKIWKYLSVVVIPIVCILLIVWVNYGKKNAIAD